MSRINRDLLKDEEEKGNVKRRVVIGPSNPTDNRIWVWTIVVNSQLQLDADITNYNEPHRPIFIKEMTKNNCARLESEISSSLHTPWRVFVSLHEHSFYDSSNAALGSEFQTDSKFSTIQSKKKISKWGSSLCSF